MSKAPSDGAAQQAAVAVAQQQKMDRTLVLLIVIFIFLAGYVGYGFLPERNYVSTTQNAGGVEAKSHTVVAISESSSAESLPRPSKPKAAPVAPVPASAFRVEQFIPSPTEALNVTLWYPVDCSWERDYFMHDLIGPAVGGLVKFRDLEPRNSPSWDRKERKNHIVDPDESNIVIFHGMIEDGQKCHNTIVEKSQYYQPAVAFILSDEHGASSCGNEKLSHLVPLVMRHYSAESHGMPRHKNVFNLPLGTNTGQKFPTRDKLQKASERPKKWAFIGNNKHDRRHMLSVLATRFPEQEQALDKQVPTHQIADVYSKAIFVPNTQGQVSYDCFRLYEATRAGAIPVMVGPPDKMKQTFGHFIGSDGEMPPWIFATSWEQAADKMEELLKDPAAVDARQKANLDWWDTVMTTTKKAIRAAVEADYARRRFAKAMGLAFREVGREDVAEWIERRPDPLSSK